MYTIGLQLGTGATSQMNLYYLINLDVPLHGLSSVIMRLGCSQTAVIIKPSNFKTRRTISDPPY